MEFGDVSKIQHFSVENVPWQQSDWQKILTELIRKAIQLNESWTDRWSNVLIMYGWNEKQ